MRPASLSRYTRQGRLASEPLIAFTHATSADRPSSPGRGVPPAIAAREANPCPSNIEAARVSGSAGAGAAEAGAAERVNQGKGTA